MTFQESIRVCLSKYADFSGRACRSEYWWFVLATFLATLAISMVSSVLQLLFSLAMLLPSIAAATRRLHDTNRSGWWQLILLIPLVGFIILVVFLAQDTQPEVQQAAA